jgi:copper chaperone NosL
MKNGILILAVLLTAPLAWAHEGHEPAETDFKSDICAECQMAVTSRSYAAQIVGSGNPLFFDDIGCLIQYERQGKVAADAIHARFVRSVAGDAWLRVDKAFWVLTKEVRTPMGYGLHAFADQKSAESFSATKAGSRLLTWKDVPMAVPAGTGMSIDGMGKL